MSSSAILMEFSSSRSTWLLTSVLTVTSAQNGRTTSSTLADEMFTVFLEFPDDVLVVVASWCDLMFSMR